MNLKYTKINKNVITQQCVDSLKMPYAMYHRFSLATLHRCSKSAALCVHILPQSPLTTHSTSIQSFYIHHTHHTGPTTELTVPSRRRRRRWFHQQQLARVADIAVHGALCSVHLNVYAGRCMLRVYLRLSPVELFPDRRRAGRAKWCGLQCAGEAVRVQAARRGDAYYKWMVNACAWPGGYFVQIQPTRNESCSRLCALASCKSSARIQSLGFSLVHDRFTAI